MISYYTDGSASPNPGPGGFAVIKDGRPWLIGGEPVGSAVNPQMTTNIRMEGLALLAALADAGNEPCQITTDSEFWINVLTKWAPTWAANNWHKKGGVKNLDIVQPLYNKYNKLYHRLIWTRGHVGTELNELADDWANQARRRGLRGVVKVDTLVGTS